MKRPIWAMRPGSIALCATLLGVVSPGRAEDAASTTPLTIARDTTKFWAQLEYLW